MAWRKGGKTPADMIKNTISAIVSMEKSGVTTKTESKVAKQLHYMRAMCSGDGESPSAPVESRVELVDKAISGEFLEGVIGVMKDLSFDAKKDFGVIFRVLLREDEKRQPLVQYLTKKTSVMDSLCEGYLKPSIVLTCGALLRECIVYEPLAKYLLYSPNFMNFFKLVVDDNFDTSSDSFATFKDLLTKHKAIVATYLNKNYDAFMEEYTKLLFSANYVTKRQSLKLLGELLLDRANFSVMTRYIGDRQNLILMMNLLRNKSKSIQFEAFHVFKVFVANPHKKPEILKILVMNKDKLLSFLTNFQNDKAKEDEQFHDEKEFLLKQIRSIA